MAAGSSARPTTRSSGQSDEQKVRDILRKAGVAQDMIEALAPTLTLDYAERVAPLLAASNPAGGTSGYAEALTTYGFSETGQLPGLSSPERAWIQHGIEAARKPYITNKSGALHYVNLGVVADPATGDVIFKENSENTPGSSAWLDKSQDSWGPKKINEWRERLANYGYDVASQGPMDQVLLATLRQYHTARYLNRGKAIPFDSSLVGKTGEDRIFDPAEVRNAVRQQFRTKLGDDPSDAELEDWSAFIKQEARKLANKKGYSPESAAVAAEERFIEHFENDPKVQFLTEVEEEQTELRDSLLGTLQAINSARLGS